MGLGAPKHPTIGPSANKRKQDELDLKALTQLVQGAAGRVTEAEVRKLIGLKEDLAAMALESLQAVEKAIQSGENLGKVALTLGHQIEKLQILMRFKNQQREIETLQQRQHER